MNASPLAWGRGSKLLGLVQPYFSVDMSPLAWGRGSKHANRSVLMCRRGRCTVAPRVGAWIETFQRLRLSSEYIMKSPIAWGRGSKHFEDERRSAPIKWHVAPRVGAWIETLCRGFAYDRTGGPVAPRVGAWIETRIRSMSECAKRVLVAPRVGAWIETTYVEIDRKPCWYGRPSRGGVDRNIVDTASIRTVVVRCRPSRVGVDRNVPTNGSAMEQGPAVAPRVGAWIETYSSAAT